VLLIAYLSLVGAVIWLLRGEDRDRIVIRRPRLASWIRVAVTSLALSLLLLGAVLVVGQSESQHPFRIVAGATLIGGSFLYVLGVALWRGYAAYRLRVVGWCLVAAVLSVPSTLTLALPVVAIMAAVLVEVPVAGRPSSSVLHALSRR
jgi:hypothetical protein